MAINFSIVQARVWSSHWTSSPQSFTRTFSHRGTAELAPAELCRIRFERTLIRVLPASCRQIESMRDGTICRRDAGSTLGVRIPGFLWAHLDIATGALASGPART